MSWLSLLKLILNIADRLFDYVSREQLLSAGEARAVQKQIGDLNDRAQKAIEARERVAADAARGKLRDDDGFRID